MPILTVLQTQITLLELVIVFIARFIIFLYKTHLYNLPNYLRTQVFPVIIATLVFLSKLVFALNEAV